MKYKYLSKYLIVLISILFSYCNVNKKNINNNSTEEVYTNKDITGKKIIISFEKGISHNHPLMACWTEDTNGKYLQTIYVAKSLATGIFNHAYQKEGKWLEGEVSRPAALPYWAHKYGTKNAKGDYIPTVAKPLPDAVTSATPKSNFKIISKLKDIENFQKINIFFEINQSWDWNQYWSNDKFPDDENYKTSSQPAVIYKATIDVTKTGVDYEMKIIGHSHYSGKDGNLYPDLSTLTTAVQIVKSIKVVIE